MPGTDTPRLFQGAFRQLNKFFVVISVNLYLTRGHYISVVEYDTDYFYPDAGANGIRLISTDNVGETQVYVYNSTGKIMYTVNINITEWKSSDEYWDDED